jgi:hypothetical protein
MASRGRPPKVPVEQQRKAVRAAERAKNLALRLALKLEELSARDREDLERLPPGLWKIVESAHRKHWRYQPAVARRAAAHSPKRGQTWHSPKNRADLWQRQEWREKVLGQGPDAGGYLRVKTLFAPIAAPRPPAYVSRIFHQIEIEIARPLAIAPRTLRHWVLKQRRKGLLPARGERLKAIRDPKAQLLPRLPKPDGRGRT